MRFELLTAIDVLRRTPQVLDSLLRGIPDDFAVGTEGGDSWSPFDIVGHIIHGERTDWIPRLRIILDHGESKPFDPYDRFAQLKANAEKRLAELLDELHLVRAESLEALTAISLSDADLDRCGRHPALGVVTARQLLATWVAHDLGHISQVTRVMAKQYRQEVGPWRAYMPVLDRT